MSLPKYENVENKKFVTYWLTLLWICIHFLETTEAMVAAAAIEAAACAREAAEAREASHMSQLDKQRN